jgi:small GTP-binding protein
MDTRYKLKIVMLGDYAVGKTSLVNRYVYNIFDERYLTTLGARISKKDVRVTVGTTSSEASLIVWDLSGNDGFQSVLPQYLKGAAGAMVVADATRPETVQNLPHHLALFRRHNPAGQVAASCNKVDLVDRSRWQALEESVSAAVSVPPELLFLTSAQDSINVEAMFAALAGRLVASLRDG